MLKNPTPLDLPGGFMSPGMCSRCHRGRVTQGVHLQHPSDDSGGVWAAGISLARAWGHRSSGSPGSVLAAPAPQHSPALPGLSPLPAHGLQEKRHGVKN